MLWAFPPQRETVVKTLIERSAVSGQAGDKPLAMWSHVSFDRPGLLASKESQRWARGPLIFLEISWNCLAGFGGSRAGKGLFSVHCGQTYEWISFSVTSLPSSVTALPNGEGTCPKGACSKDESMGVTTTFSGSALEDDQRMASPKEPGSAKSWSECYKTGSKGGRKEKREEWKN